MDKNARNKKKSVFKKRTSYGQILRFFEVDLFPPFAAVPDEEESLHLVLALVEPAKLHACNSLGQPHSNTTTASLVIDVSMITDVVGRAKDVSGDTVFVQRTGAVTYRDVPDSGSDDVT